MGELIYADQPVLQNSLSNEFLRLYMAIKDAYHKHGKSSKCIQALKQFINYFYRQTIQKKQYTDLRSQLIDNVHNTGASQRCEFFSDDKITGSLYALPATDSISLKKLKGNVNILTIDHGAVQIEQDATKFRLLSERLTIGQSSINLKSDKQIRFHAKTNVAVFMCISCNQD